MKTLHYFYEWIVSFYQGFFSWFFDLQFFDADKVVVSTKFTEAHIFGSGASIITSKILAKKNAFKMTCNLAAAVLPQWELVLVEKLGITDYGNKQFSLLLQRKINNIVLKNIYPWYFNIKPGLVKKLSNVYLLRECQIQQDDNLEYVVDKLLISRAKYYQYASSILTMIIIAKNLGFKKIVLHGIDFDQSSFTDNIEYNQFSFKLKSNLASTKHSTETLQLPVSAVLKQLIRLLKAQGVDILFANELA